MSDPTSIHCFRRRALGLAGLLAGFAACAKDAWGPDGPTEQVRHPLVEEAAHYVGASRAKAKELALTFDDGPGPRTAELSTYLRSEGIRAVFFVNGACIRPTELPNSSCPTPTPNSAEILAQLSDDGHLVGNHSTTHRDMTLVPSSELLQDLSETDAVIASYARTPPERRLFRAPFGAWNASVAAQLSGSPMAGYVGPVYWDIGGTSDRYPHAAADWACFQGTLRTASGALMHGARDGAHDGFATTEECGDAYRSEIDAVGRGIVLMHDPYGWARGHTVDMVKYLVPKLKRAGYMFVRADEIPVIADELPRLPEDSRDATADARVDAGSDAGDAARRDLARARLTESALARQPRPNAGPSAPQDPVLAVQAKGSSCAIGLYRHGEGAWMGALGLLGIGLGLRRYRRLVTSRRRR